MSAIYSKYLGGSGGGGGSGITTVGAIDSQPLSVNGAVISGSSIYFQTATSSKPGMVVKGNLTDVGTDGITITGGTGAVIGSGTSISQHVADSTHNGYLSSTDWSTFNAKEPAVTKGNLTDVGTDGITVTGGTGAVIGSGTSISQHVADSTHNGYLSSTDWSTFNAKQAALSFGNLTDAGTDGITVTGGTGAVIGSGTSISQHVADSTHNGYLSSTDWSTFNAKQAAGNYITALTGDVTASGPGSVAATIAAGAVTGTKIASNTVANSNLSQMATLTVKGNNTGGSASPIDLTVAQTKAMLNTVPTVQTFLSTGTTTGYAFTISAGNATAGATYTNNGQTFTVVATITAGTLLTTTATGAPQSSGTLTKATGTGDSTLTFSATQAMATYTRPSNVLYVKIKMVGGGGGGGGGGDDTSGAGGTGGAGGSTLFGGSVLIANGGAGGISGGAGGAGGTASILSGSGTALSGATGSGYPVQTNNTTNTYAGGAAGASTPFGGGGGGANPNSNGSAGISNTGAGGGGGAGTHASVIAYGGAGGGAGGYVEAIITSPNSTYLYAIGAAGTAGTKGAAATASAGGAGGSGYIIVEEYYQ